MKVEKIKFLTKGLLSTFFFSAILFICAGRINYIQGWIYFSTTIISTLMNFFFIQNNIELIIERSKPGTGTKSWDKLLLGLSAIVFIVIIVLAGFDSGRYYWSVQLHWSIYALGSVITISGQLIFITARSQNKFFSTVMRIQKEKEHSVCRTGLYKTIRHPGYLGMSVSLFAIPLITGSLWSFIPATIAILLLLIRTSLEDKTLINELEGYLQYTQETRYKLIPYIW
jgi:protein-S-isoprenylcysteine O-methyltransferase Ste14